VNYKTPNSKVKAKWNIIIGSIFIISFILIPFVNAKAESVSVHANIVWEMTDVVIQENMILSWNVDKNDLWSFNTQLFPEGHTADGILVNALKDYALPEQPMGKLIGRIGDFGRKFPMGLSGSIHILPSEDGEFLYLSMNNDIIGLYVKGFKNNGGEIIVEVKQIRIK